MHPTAGGAIRKILNLGKCNVFFFGSSPVKQARYGGQTQMGFSPPRNRLLKVVKKTNTLRCMV